MTVPVDDAQRERGFTLVEILVAFTIAAIMLLPLLRSFSGALSSAANSEAYEQADTIAESALATLGASVPLVDGNGFERQEGRFTVTATMHRYAIGDGSGYVIPYDLSVTVGWGEGRQARRIVLHTLRIGPQP